MHVAVATGPEVIAGSTRMKAGTAQKLLLNAFSTALMVRTGPHVLEPDGRGRRAVTRSCAGGWCASWSRRPAWIRRPARDAAERADGDCRVALVSLLAEVPVDGAPGGCSPKPGRRAAGRALAGADGAAVERSVSGNEGAQTMRTRRMLAAILAVAALAAAVG